MASWYRRFIQKFSAIVAPITDLLKKNRPFKWNQACKEAWSKLRERLVPSPILTCPDFDHDFVIQTDASDYGFGAVLTQDIKGQERVSSFLSRSLLRTESNYSTVKKECLAVLWAIEKLRPYTEGSHFTVLTDHYLLC